MFHVPIFGFWSELGRGERERSAGKNNSGIIVGLKEKGIRH